MHAFFRRFLASLFVALCILSSASYAEDGKSNHTKDPLSPSPTEISTMPEMAYSEALNDAKAGKVDEILIRGGRGLPEMFVRMKDGKIFKSTLPTYRLEDAWTQTPVTIRADNGGAIDNAVSHINEAISLAMGVMVVILMSNFLRQMIRPPTKQGIKAAKIDRISFDDVAGQDEAKKELMEVVEFLKAPEKFHAVGARIPRGVLLEGDPGNGKTLLAKAVAGEAGVAFYHIDGPEIVEMFAGLGARRIRKAFAQCRKRSLMDIIRGRKSSAILFIDEIDTIGGRRRNAIGGDGATSEREQTLNQLLVEMDGIGKNGSIVVIGATNRSDTLDPALVRAGRLDRHITVSRPDLAGRVAILEVHSRKVRMSEDVSLHEVARMIPGFSGADVANIVNEAAIQAARMGKPEVDMECFHAARDRQLMGVERPTSGMSEEERRVAAYHEAGHAIVALRSKHSDPVQKITIIPRGRALGAVIRLPEGDRYLVSKAKLEDDLAVTMGGRAAEALVFGDHMITSGASADIEMCTIMAREMLGRWGMSKKLGRVNYLGTSDGRATASEGSLMKLDEAVKEQIDSAYEKAYSILTSEREAMDVLVAKLAEVETMTGDEARAILDMCHGQCENDLV